MEMYQNVWQYLTMADTVPKNKSDHVFPSTTTFDDIVWRPANFKSSALKGPER